MKELKAELERLYLRDEDKIIELMGQQIAELEKRNQSLLSLTMRMVDRWWCFVHKALFASDTAKALHKEAVDAISNEGDLLIRRDLEQQAKGIEDAIELCKHSFDKWENVNIGELGASETDLKRRVEQLRKQAENMK